MATGGQPDFSTMVAALQAMTQVLGQGARNTNSIANTLASGIGNIAPRGASNSTGSGTSVAATTAALVAPSNGAAIVVSQAVFGTGASSVVVTASLVGLVGLASQAAGGSGFAWAYLPMSEGQSSTFTGTATAGGATTIGASIVVFFLPGA